MNSHFKKVGAIMYLERTLEKSIKKATKSFLVVLGSVDRKYNDF